MEVIELDPMFVNKISEMAFASLSTWIRTGEIVGRVHAKGLVIETWAWEYFCHNVLPAGASEDGRRQAVPGCGGSGCAQPQLGVSARAAVTIDGHVAGLKRRAAANCDLNGWPRYLADAALTAAQVTDDTPGRGALVRHLVRAVLGPLLFGCASEQGCHASCGCRHDRVRVPATGRRGALRAP